MKLPAIYPGPVSRVDAALYGAAIILGVAIVGFNHITTLQQSEQKPATSPHLEQMLVRIIHAAASTL
mgnify:CR=1 FL=1